MAEKLLYILGGETQFKDFFAIKEALSGSRIDLLDRLKEKRRSAQAITVICDVQDKKEFPIMSEDFFWSFFSTAGQNRILFILHERFPAIEAVIKAQKQTHNVSGPLYWGASLKDGTPLSDMENEMLLLTVFKVFPDLQSGLEGVLAARLFLPDVLLQLPEQMNAAYKKELHEETRVSFDGSFDLLQEDLDLSKFPIKWPDEPIFDVDLHHPEEVVSNEARNDRVITGCFAEKNFVEMLSEIRRVRDTELVEKIKHAKGNVTLHGAVHVLKKMEDASERCRERRKDTGGSIEDIPGIISKIGSQAKAAIASIIESQTLRINELVGQYKKIWKYFLFLIHSRSMQILGLIIVPLIAIFLKIVLRQQMFPSFLLSSCLWIIVTIVAWMRAKTRKQKEIVEACDRGNNLVNKSLAENLKRIPSLIWDRNLNLMDAKLLEIYGEYIGRSLDSLRILAETRPQDITDKVFKAMQRLVFFVPSDPVHGSHIDYSDFDAYLGIEKSELVEYFGKKLIRLARTSRMHSLAQASPTQLNNFNEFFNQPDLGLVWNEEEIVDFRSHTIEKYLFKPPGFSIDPLQLNWSGIADFEAAAGGTFSMVALVALFPFR